MKSCLIVDDSKVIRMVARRILEELDACHEVMPDAVLLDWNMPVMDGLEFLHALRGSAAGREVVVVFCTTENDMSHIQRAIAAGADEYIMKPFDRDIIETKFSQVGLL